MPILQAVLLPFLLQTGLVVLFQQYELWSNDPIWWDWLPMAVSTIVGFLPLGRKYRRYALLIGIVYIPMMASALTFFTVLLIGHVYGDWL